MFERSGHGIAGGNFPNSSKSILASGGKEFSIQAETGMQYVVLVLERGAKFFPGNSFPKLSSIVPRCRDETISIRAELDGIDWRQVLHGINMAAGCRIPNNNRIAGTG